VPNAAIKRDLKVLSVRQEVRNYSVTYRQRLDDHPDRLEKYLFQITNPLKPDDPYMGRTAPLTSRRRILNIYSTNTRAKYFKHAAHTPFFSLQNAIYFIMLPCLVPVLFAFYVQVC
jgi:hypothetical protein